MILLCESVLWRLADCAQFLIEMFSLTDREKRLAFPHMPFFPPVVDGHQIGNLTLTFFFA